jgi:TPR repeat protein
VSQRVSKRPIWLGEAARPCDRAILALFSTLAQKNLGLMYANGLGVTKDDQEAFKYFDPGFYERFSAEQGDAVLDLYIDGLLEILGQVTLVERAFAN